MNSPPSSSRHISSPASPSLPTAEPTQVTAKLGQHQKLPLDCPESQVPLSTHNHDIPMPAANMRTPEKNGFGAHLISPDPKTPAASPPTPSYSPGVMTTRSGRPVVKTSDPLKSLSGTTDRVSKKPARKRKERAKAERLADFKMVTPLSQLAQNLTLKIVDIEAYVHRPADVRQRELETGKNPGKVKRPMNAFMLYRKAYQNVAKEWCTHNNHQVVSQVCGDSWPLEPAHIRDQFNEWARIERDNHQLAHPGYKFTPAKPRHSKKKTEVEESDDGSDIDDYDWDKRKYEGIKRPMRAGTAAGFDGNYKAPPGGYYHAAQQSAFPHSGSPLVRQTLAIPHPHHHHHHQGVPDGLLGGDPNLDSFHHHPEEVLSNDFYWQQHPVNRGYQLPYAPLSPAPADAILGIASSPGSSHGLRPYGDEFPGGTAYPDPGYVGHHHQHDARLEPYPDMAYLQPHHARDASSGPYEEAGDRHQSVVGKIDPGLLSASDLVVGPFFVGDTAADNHPGSANQFGEELSQQQQHQQLWGSDGSFGGFYNSQGPPPLLHDEQQAHILKGAEDWQIEQLDDWPDGSKTEETTTDPPPPCG